MNKYTIPLLFFFFILAACGGGGSSSSSNTGNSISTPSSPTAVTATAGNGQVTLSWTAVTGATSYNAYYRNSAGVTTANGTKITGATSGSAITGLTNGTAYYFIVMAVNAGGESAASAEVSATPQVPVPGAPTGVSATVGNGQVTLSWTAVTGATSYNAYYRNSAGVTTANGTKVTGATSGSAITGLTNGTAYYFIVTAVNASGESAASAEVGATPQLPVPVPDTGQTTKYSTAFGDDSDYLISPPSYTDNGNGIITDNVTGLMWQKQDDGVKRDWMTAGTYCAGLSLGGYSASWRLPSKKNLVGIVNYGASLPAINTTYFPGTNALSYYWTSTTYVGLSATAWAVSFYNGAVTTASEGTSLYYVRCVRP